MFEESQCKKQNINILHWIMFFWKVVMWLGTMSKCITGTDALEKPSPILEPSGLELQVARSLAPRLTTLPEPLTLSVIQRWTAQRFSHNLSVSEHFPRKKKKTCLNNLLCALWLERTVCVWSCLQTQASSGRVFLKGIVWVLIIVCAANVCCSGCVWVTI